MIKNGISATCEGRCSVRSEVYCVGTNGIGSVRLDQWRIGISGIRIAVIGSLDFLQDFTENFL